MQSTTARWLWVILLLASLAWVGSQTRVWDTTLRVYAQRLQPEGAALPDHPRDRVFLDNDPYYWVIYAGEMVETGAWRIRHTLADNAPEGRPVHWSQSMTWLLVAFGAACRALTGQAWSGALEDGAIWVNPFLQVLLVGAGSWLLLRRAGWWPALAWVLGVFSLGDMAWSFHPLRPDHQSLHVLFGALSMLLLGWGGLGWVSASDEGEEDDAGWRVARPPRESVARGYLVASGVLGGLGLWTGASVQLLLLGSAVAAALYLVMAMPVGQPEATYRPGLWRWWAVSGAATSLAMYLVEYAGAWSGLRLEVNSPLHALSWLCAGELLARVAQRRMEGWRGGRAGLLPWGVGALAVPLAIALGPAAWHAMHAVDMKRMHNFIQEFYTFTHYTRGVVWPRFFSAYGWLPLLIPLAALLSGPGRSRTYEWGLLWLGFALATAMSILAWQQVRWMPFFAIMLLGLLPTVLAVLARSRPAGLSHLHRALLALMLVQSLWFAGRQAQEVRASLHNRALVVEEFTKAVLNRNLAIQLGAANTGGTFRVMAEPDIAGPLYYFGRISSVPSFYWENRAGLADAIAFFAATNAEVAREVAARRGLTHLLLPQGRDLADQFHFMRAGYFDGGEANATFVAQLAQRKLPPWVSLDIGLSRVGHQRYRFGPGVINSTITVLDLQPRGPAR